MHIYKNGIINMMIILLKCREDNSILKELGWIYLQYKSMYDENQLKYLEKIYENYEKRKKIVDRKYYLTQDEMKRIMTI